MMSDASAAAIAMAATCAETVFGIVSACAAGANAIGAAARAIQCGDADAVVTGGSEAALTPLARAAFAALDALSQTGVSRPSTPQRRTGLVMGEGAGVLVLEDGERARARGAEVLAIVRGVGTTCDARRPRRARRRCRRRGGDDRRAGRRGRRARRGRLRQQ